jgi:hypothetical protein
VYWYSLCTFTRTLFSLHWHLKWLHNHLQYTSQRYNFKTQFQSPTTLLPSPLPNLTHTATFTCCYKEPKHIHNRKSYFHCTMDSTAWSCTLHPNILYNKAGTAESPAVCCKGLYNLARCWTPPYKPSFQLPRAGGLDSGSHGVTVLKMLTSCSHAMPWERRETSTSALFYNLFIH